ncbi:MAG: LptF/LptG family permease [Bacteroidales bacterium]|nr:LptF/LptG family permease [Bacteroidales bacterium]MCL2738114.1 LptF/LptG family permease [Bacteroidales bacterium]
MKCKLNILDRYIIRTFITTYFFAILLIIGIVIIFDISEKIDDFVAKEAPLRAIIVDYYFNFIPYFVNMFSPLFVFITVIFFTSKLASNSEIIAMLSGGISFNRMLRPYFISAFVIALMSLSLNLFVIPPANKNRLAFEEQYMKKAFDNLNRNIHFQLEPNQFVYMESFFSLNNTANRFTLETFSENQLVSKLSADRAVWDANFMGWRLEQYFIRHIDGDIETIERGQRRDTVLNLTVQELKQRKSAVEALDYYELNQEIEKLKMRGDNRVKYAQIQKNTRLAVPFSAFILTLMGVALSSRKRRGGIGLNIGVGIALSFTYILFLRFSEMFVHSDVLPPLVALWVPNMLFAIVAVVLYRLAPK